MSMLHGQEPGEYIYDIEFVPDDTKTEQKVCPLLNKYELIHKYDLQWDSYYGNLNNIPMDPNISYSGEGSFSMWDPNNDSFASVYSDDNPNYAESIHNLTHTPSIEGVNLFGNDSSIEGTPLNRINRYVGTPPNQSPQTPVTVFSLENTILPEHYNLHNDPENSESSP